MQTLKPGSRDDRQPPISTALLVIVAFFVTTLVTANIIAVKLVTLGPLVLPAAVIIFPISYIFGDVLTEVYGYHRARQAIWLGFACNLFAVAAIWLAGALPAAPFWAISDGYDMQAAYARILGFVPRIVAASFIAYLIGEFANAMVLSRLKVRTAGRHLWLRTIGSTVVGQGLDSAVFISLAFGPAPQLILSQWLFKTVYEAAATPLTYWVVARLKAIEGIDVYDKGISLSPLPWRGSEGEALEHG